MYAKIFFFLLLIEPAVIITFRVGGFVFGGHHSRRPREENSAKNGQSP